VYIYIYKECGMVCLFRFLDQLNFVSVHIKSFYNIRRTVRFDMPNSCERQRVDFWGLVIDHLISIRDKHVWPLKSYDLTLLDFLYRDMSCHKFMWTNLEPFLNLRRKLDEWSVKLTGCLYPSGCQFNERITAYQNSEVSHMLDVIIHH